MAKIAFDDKSQTAPYDAAHLNAQDVNAIKESVNDLYDQVVPGSTVMRGLLTQTGVAAPVLTILENTTGLDFVPERHGVGMYFLYPEIEAIVTPPDAGKVILLHNQGQGPVGHNKIDMLYFGSGQVVINTYNPANATPLDGVLQNCSIEFRVYPA